MSETPKWYVVHTYSGYENKVAQNIEKFVENQGLGDLIFEVSIPTETVVEYKDDKKREVERKIFPGYVLVKMILTDDSWYVIRNIRGVTGFVGPASKPIPLTDEEVEKLGVEVRTVEVDYTVGNNVKIIHGPLEGFIGRVEEIDVDKNIVKVTVSMFGRDTLAELQLGQVELVQD
ncbi:MAG: transcription termination/antitermination protein NusG [Candidatus Merdivicinus sp.]|jgi:transcriptional antiterminator NusG